MKSKRVQALVLAAAVAGGIRGRGGLLGLGACRRSPSPPTSARATA